LLLGLRAWEARGSADVVVVNSDLFADAAWFSTLLDGITRSGEPAALAVDGTRGHTEEAMKVGLDATGRRVAAIGKVGIDRPGGEYVGLAWWAADSAAELRAVLHGFVAEPSRSDNWYEHGIQCHLDAGGRYAAVAVPSDRWVEIDDEADLEAARRLPMGG
jgi:choline kinase